jgi:hypothetical protein
MFKFLFRFTGLWLLAGAFVAFVIDGARSIAASRMVFMPLLEAWSAVSTGSIEVMQRGIEQNLSPWIWESLAMPLLKSPLWLVLGVLGCLFLLIGRRRTYSVGYSSRD